MGNENHSIKFGTKTIAFQLKYSERQTLGISVLPNASVMVTSPIGKNLEQIKLRVKQRAKWIIKQQNYFREYLSLQPQRQYVSGETHYYLGKQYRLKVIESQKKEVKLKRNYIFVHLKNKTDKTQIQKLIDEWYLKLAGIQFNKRLEECWNIVRKYDVSFPNLSIRKMSKRWGTCGTNNTIYLNPNLVKAPSVCVEYVVIHELCHLKYPYHNKDFFRLLEKVLPDWEKRKSRLETVGQNFI